MAAAASDAVARRPESAIAPRDEKGRFVKGSSGNPDGRPKGRKNIISRMKQDLEIALRENLTEKDVHNVVKAMLDEALKGNVGAGKLILDKVMSNAKEAEDEKDSSGGLKIVIENATLDILQENNRIIDVQAEEVENVETD